MEKAGRSSASTSSRSLVLSEIVRSPGASRRRIADELGIVPATVGSHVKKLLEHRFVRELKPDVRGNGRPSIPLEADLERGYLMGVALERERASMAAVSLDGAIIGSRTVACRHTEDQIRPVVEGIAALRAQLDPLPALAMGITVSGATNQSRGEVVMSTVLGWTDRSIGTEIAAATGLEVFIENDVIALASREIAFAPSLPDSFLLLHLDDGIGMSIVIDRTILRGVARDSTEFGHTTLLPDGQLCRCGGHGCVQTVFGWAELDAACPGGLAALEVEEDVALEFFRERAGLLGRAVGTVATLLGIESVRVTGRTTRYWPLGEQSFRDSLSRSTTTLGGRLDVEIVEWTELTMAAGGAGLALAAYLETLR